MTDQPDYEFGPAERQLSSCVPDKDNSNQQLLLTERHLHILQNSEVSVYQLAAIMHAEARHIRIMGYYLAGGLLAAISILAMTNDVLAPIYGISGAMLGAFMFYIGWRGKNMLVLVLLNGPETKWMSGDFQPLLQFIMQFNNYLTWQRSQAGPENDTLQI